MARYGVSVVAVVLTSLALGACQTTKEASGAGVAADNSGATETGRELASGATVDTPSMEKHEKTALERGYSQVTGLALRDLVEGQTYSFDHPRGAEITMTYSPDGTTHARWEHPAGLSGEFDERWTIEDNAYLCAWGTKGDVCGTMFSKGDRLVRIRADGRMDLYEHHPQLVGQR